MSTWPASNPEDDANHYMWFTQLTKKWHRNLDNYDLLRPSNPSLSATGKSILIIGASGPLGRSMVKAWSMAGAKNLVLTGRDVEVLNDVATDALKKVEKVVVQPAELTSEDEVRALWEVIWKEVGQVDVLIHSAGSLIFGSFKDLEPDKWFTSYEVNVKSLHTMIHYLLKRQSTGTIITVISGGAGSNMPMGSSHYPSKLVQAKIMELLQIEQPDLRCFSVIPGMLNTDETPPLYRKWALDDPMLAAALSLFLATERANWMRGSIVSANWDIEELEANRQEIEAKSLIKLSFLNGQLSKGGHPWEKDR